MKAIPFDQFSDVELRVGVIKEAISFPEARKPAYRIKADFGSEIGVLETSAQVTDLYQPEDLIGRQIIGVINIPARQIGPVRSTFLLTGFYQPDGAVVLAIPERDVPVGSKLA